ncbi:hypothetical protein [Pendulispora albinea]|uniref:Carboxypeptidase-like regulatory domain-containing protein n=1 Tax=Pendulispora albinea TaxID=2741071 RepID=A0ABZ2LLP5_9BACT
MQSNFAPGQGAVHGYIDAQIGEKGTIALPDATVRLRRVSDALMTAPVRTDVKGFFIAPGVPSGTYTTCITAAGFTSGCSNAQFLVKSGKISNPPHAVFSPNRVPVYGRVSLSDKSDVRYENQLFATEVDTFVRASTPGGALVAGPVRANARGEYVIGGLPPGANYRILATSESSNVEKTVALATSPLKNDMSFGNRRPQVSEVNALQGGKGVRHVEAGSKVTVTAQAGDPDGGALHYRWIAPGGSCPPTDAPSVECTMPASLGTQSIFVQVSDGIGEYAVGRVRVAVGPAISLFSGTLVDGAAKVPGAEVKVNGVSVVSDANGAFAVTVPEKDRYVLTIRKDGYQLISKVFLEERTGAVYKLLKADKTPLDPTKDNLITVMPPRDETGGQSGFKAVSLLIKAGSIVDESGHPVVTPAFAFTSRFDHLFDKFDRMPGDYGAIDSSGQDVTLTSYGAIEVNLRGPAGEKYNIMPGKPADLEYEVHASQIGSAPASMPLWYYNEDKGLWEEDGKATLVGTRYKTQAKHFSAINVDIAKTNATCLKLVVDQTTLSVPFNIRLTVPGSPPAVRDRAVTENVTAIVRLPPNVAGTTIDVLDGSNNPIPNSHRVFSTGNAVAAGTNLSLAAPYNDCITPPSPPVTLGLDLPQDPNPTYLSYLSNPGANDAAKDAYASTYYTAIGADADLTAWKNRNDFGAGDDASAFYFNAGDLEFGRSMHMRRRADGSIAYYVTNFKNADLALGGLSTDVIATVAMEYSAYPSVLPGAPKFTKFYVFDKTDARVNKAELDNRGDKYVPGLCMVCHGGTFPADITAGPTPGDVAARFIPFDLKSFAYPAMLARPAQEQNFRKLNEGVYLHTNATDSQKALIEAWYAPGGVSSPGEVQHDGIANIPFLWNSGTTAADKSFYYDVVRPSCRSCHNSRIPDFDLDWGSPAAIANRATGVNNAVCSGGYMPQAFVTWRNFWHSTTPSQPATVASYMTSLGVGGGTCTGP